MALDILSARIDSDRTQAATLNASFNATVERIRANPTLSPEGKRRQIASAYLDTTAAIQKLQADEKANIEAKRVELNRNVFGTQDTDPSSIIAFRDAQDRADRLTTADEAQRLLDRSMLNGDDTLASAILERALGEAWRNVVDEYTAKNPDRASQLADLSSINNYGSRANVFNTYVAYATPLPAELSGLQPAQIQQLTTA